MLPLAWAVSLMPSTEQSRALAEVDAPALNRAMAFIVESEAHYRGERPGIPTDPTAALRAARTVLDGDASLAAAPVDWPAVADAHEREPFGRIHRRSLIARRDCPDDVTAALLTPWDPAVANRLVARQAELPEWTWWPSLRRLGETRPSLVRHVLTERNLPAVLRAATRIDLLVNVVNGYDHNHIRYGIAFWDAVGAMLRSRLGSDRRAWLAAARRLPEHPGSLEGLCARSSGAVENSGRRLPDLRILAQAPPEVLAATVARLDDEDLEHAMEESLRDVDSRQELRAPILARLRRGGVPDRAPIARWVRYARSGVHEDQAWLYGADDENDQRLSEWARTNTELCRLIAARFPRALTADLVTELRECSGPIEAQAVLDSACGDDTTPWSELVRAHTAEPLSEPVLCVLAARPGFPDVLAHALPARRLMLLARRGATAARVALTRPDCVYLATRDFRWSGLVDRIRFAGVLTDESVLRAFRPAREALDHGCRRPGNTPENNAWRAVCAKHLEQAAARTGPGFWHGLAERLPDFEGSLPELLVRSRDGE
ncbi:hypothetical protein AB0I72_24775 [Nocardiopsis sp. NPDC049922]|uniref:hypothetical protein n=1 Tax=Nocardiopsis sp. NPDC049922 TaxID=3155157 RepID=UPI0033EF0D6C